MKKCFKDFGVTDLLMFHAIIYPPFLCLFQIKTTSERSDINILLLFYYMFVLVSNLFH